MPELRREIFVSRIALLELEDERRLAREGHELLDEKRVLLAAEMRRRLAQLRSLRAEAQRATELAQGALRAALVRHGLDELAVYPPLDCGADHIELTPSWLLGLELTEARLERGPERHTEIGVNETRQARACALAYRQLVAPLVALAACAASLRRLAREYARTERRTRAIENVLLPEIDAALKLIRDELESVDLEEIARTRHGRR
ncbi:MAG TPA: V-type ATP synthase subunit D [Steroidobacteraceae bacterium]|nr:V-type ATP synthase subunit D [Steroidobacteraceae bacterium]